jgi:hypothetical protein
LFNNRLIVLEVLSRPFLGFRPRISISAGRGAFWIDVVGRAGARFPALSRRGYCDKKTVSQQRP